MFDIVLTFASIRQKRTLHMHFQSIIKENRKGFIIYLVQCARRISGITPGTLKVKWFRGKNNSKLCVLKRANGPKYLLIYIYFHDKVQYTQICLDSLPSVRSVTWVTLPLVQHSSLTTVTSPTGYSEWFMVYGKCFILNCRKGMKYNLRVTHVSNTCWLDVGFMLSRVCPCMHIY